MRRFLVLGIAACLAPIAVGSPILGITPVQTSMAPESSAFFEITLSDAQSFAGFYLELGIAAQPGAEGAVSFGSAYGDTDPRYCFYGTNDLFQAVAINDALLALGDQTSPSSIEVSTVAGVNDLLAIVEVNSSADAWGEFDLLIDVPSIELFDQYGDPIPGIDQVSIEQATIVVPEPSTFALLGFAALTMIRRGVARGR